MHGLTYDIAHLLAGSLVLVSFMLLYQDRLYALLNVYALHALVLAASVAWQAYAQGAPHLYITAAIALLFKAILIPVVLHRIIVRLGIHREIETVGGIGLTVLLGMGLVALAMVVTLRATEGVDLLAREDLAFALAVVAARSAHDGHAAQCRQPGGRFHVVGERAGACRHRRQGHAAGGRDQRRLLHPDRLHRHRHLLVPHPRALRHGRCRSSGPLSGRARMNFDPVTLLLAIPTVAALLIALMPGSRASATLNTGASSLTFLAALSLLFVERPAPGAYLLVDEFSTIFLVLINFVSFTTSVFSATYVAHEVETGRVTPGFLRLYHALYQALTLAFNLALLSNNIGIMWVAIELATLTTVVMVGIYRTHAAIEAAWKYFILASVGIALALFGTILVYMAAEPVMGAGLNAMIWTDLVSHAASLEPAMLNLAFVFLLLGYGTKIGLFPLHAWLPDAHAEGPTPITAVLSGLLLNVALYALLRCKMLMAGNPGALAPGPLMILMGLVSLLFGAFMLYRRRDIKRLFAYSSIEHMGLITFAFGLGGPLANFAGLLHMVLHSLTKSAIFFSVGDISQVKGTQKIAEMGGLTKTNPLIGWGLVIGVAAIAGLPPLGIFTSEFLTVSATLAAKPWLALPLVLGLLIAVGALFLQLNRIAFGEPKGANHKVKCSYIPMFVHLALVLAACIYLPATLVAWFQAVARLLG